MIVKRAKVLGAGLVALDLVVSPDAGVPVQAWAGGTCGNVLSILAWHGWDTYPIARANGDAASLRVMADMRRWGVNLDLISCGPTTNTPIVVQQIRRSTRGESTHKFTWTCLHCGGWLPSFKPITKSTVAPVASYLEDCSVFFFDRVSRATIEIAQLASEKGAVVVFEPSGRGDGKLFREALGVSHIVKYSDQRLSPAAVPSRDTNLILEIQTLGSEGLQFRLPGNRRNALWHKLDATSVDLVVDSCGSGDWCTAGVLSRIASNGMQGLEGSSLTEVEDALRYGQKLAAWNCRFEGARGGMYSDGLKGLPEESSELLFPVLADGSPTENSGASDSLINCPRCEAA